MIQLAYCTVEYTPYGCITRFPDGSEIGAWPHYDDHHYHVIAHRCGYGDDVLAYCREHEVAHSFVAERIMGRPSIVLWPLAHKQDPNPSKALLEEMAAQQFQRWVRANERPILAGAPWDDLKQEFIGLVESHGP